MSNPFEQYAFVGPFADGLAMASDKNGKCLHIHEDGTPAYEQRFDDIGNFHCGLALAGLDGKQFHIHTDGTPAYQGRFDSVSSFDDGESWVQQGNQRFFIDHEGKRVSPIFPVLADGNTGVPGGYVMVPLSSIKPAS